MDTCDQHEDGVFVYDRPPYVNGCNCPVCEELSIKENEIDTLHKDIAALSERIEDLEEQLQILEMFKEMLDTYEENEKS